MKTHKFLRAITLCAALLGVSGTGAQAFAQRGEKTLGVMGGIATYNSGGFSEVYFQYTIANHVRLAPDLGYVFRNEGKSAFVFDVDVQLPFRLGRGVNIYPLAGVAFNNWSWKGGGHESRLGMNFGGGIDVYLTQSLKLNLQGKYSMMNDTGGGFIGLGLGYIF